jgi:GNAT superfamily N-acetyltransferase
VEEKIVWFAYHHQEPIALFLNLPDLNQWFQHLNGKFGLWEKLKFLWIKRTRINPRFTGIAFGVVPEFQGKGVDSYLINEAKKVIQPLHRYDTYELQWIGEFNPKMMNVAQNIGDTFPSRKLITYRYLFDRSRTFHTHPML